MYLPAVDYAAFRIETSQFHDSEPKKKLPPRFLPFTLPSPWSNRTFPVESRLFPGCCIFGPIRKPITSLV